MFAAVFGAGWVVGAAPAEDATRCMGPGASGEFAAAAAPGAAMSYHLERPTPLSRFDNRQIGLLEKLNRADRTVLGSLSEIVVPDRWNLPTLDYSPMPEFAASFASEPTALIVDVPAQVFGAYENGRLVRWGPVNTGRRYAATPPGLYHLNWKSRFHISSVDSSWRMPYYFSISDHPGIGMHEYHMPGKPASHGCIRMLRRDAKWLFNWGRGPEFSDGKKIADGTPVLVVGWYYFGTPKPWLQLEWLARGVELPAGPAVVASAGCPPDVR